jgi:hypothetical protein
MLLKKRGWKTVESWRLYTKKHRLTLEKKILCAARLSALRVAHCYDRRYDLRASPIRPTDIRFPTDFRNPIFRNPTSSCNTLPGALPGSWRSRVCRKR